jgi:hypothetical protein
MNIDNLIHKSQPYISSIDLQWKDDKTINWSSIGSVSTEIAREFALKLLQACDEIDSRGISNEKV